MKHEEDGDYYLEINSLSKQFKETSKNRKFKERFEEELQKAKDSLTKKNGKKNYEKVIERVGRPRQKYLSISKYYVNDYIADDPKNPKTWLTYSGASPFRRTWTNRAASFLQDQR